MNGTLTQKYPPYNQFELPCGVCGEAVEGAWKTRISKGHREYFVDDLHHVCEADDGR